MKKHRVWAVTIPTRGYVVYEVKAETEEDAKSIVSDGGGRCVEENSGDWDESDEWEVTDEEE